MQKITSMLWFDDQAEAAADHYISVFSRRPGSNRGQSDYLRWPRLAVGFAYSLPIWWRRWYRNGRSMRTREPLAGC